MFASITKKASSGLYFLLLAFYSLVNLSTCLLVNSSTEISYFFQSSVLNELIGSPSQNRSPSAQSLNA